MHFCVLKKKNKKEKEDKNEDIVDFLEYQRDNWLFFRLFDIKKIIKKEKSKLFSSSLWGDHQYRWCGCLCVHRDTEDGG